jgi:Uma2 family endonuclease
VKPVASVKFTYDDLANLPADRERHEIIDGRHHVTPSPNTKHQAISANLSAILWHYLRRNPIGAVFSAPFDVVLSDINIVQPDVLYVSRERADLLTDQHLRGAPDLVIEIVSTGTRRTDEITKRKLYEEHGVLEYWVLDPELEAIKIYRRHDHAFVRVAELSVEGPDVLTTPSLPGFSVTIAEIFASSL